MLRGTGAKAGEDTPGQARGHSLSTYTQTFMFPGDGDTRDFLGAFTQIGSRLREWYQENL